MDRDCSKQVGKNLGNKMFELKFVNKMFCLRVFPFLFAFLSLPFLCFDVKDPNLHCFHLYIYICTQYRSPCFCHLFYYPFLIPFTCPFSGPRFPLSLPLLFFSFPPSVLLVPFLFHLPVPQFHLKTILQIIVPAVSRPRFCLLQSFFCLECLFCCLPSFVPHLAFESNSPNSRTCSKQPWALLTAITLCLPCLLLSLSFLVLSRFCIALNLLSLSLFLPVLSSEI